MSKQRKRKEKDVFLYSVTLSNLTEYWLSLGGILTAPCASNMLGVHDIAEACFGWLIIENRLCDMTDIRAESPELGEPDRRNKFPGSFRIDLFGIRLRIRG